MALAVAVPISDHPVLPSRERSTRKFVSFEELSVQLRLIWLDEAAEAVRLLGAGSEQPVVVALAVLL